MKTLKLFVVFAVTASLLAFASCGKDSATGQEPDNSPVIPEYPVKYTITVDDVKLNYAKIGIVITGDEESAGESEVVRYVVAKASEVGDLKDFEAAQTYITRNGEPIGLPYLKIQQGLEENTDYVVGIVSYDADMNINGYMVELFKTKSMDDLPSVGDESGAGDLTINPL